MNTDGVVEQQVRRAERLGLSQQRNHNYISDQTEPDFETLVRICRALAVEPNAVLGFAASHVTADEVAVLTARISAVMGAMALTTLRLTAALVETLAREQETVAAVPIARNKRVPQSITPKPRRDVHVQ